MCVLLLEETKLSRFLTIWLVNLPISLGLTALAVTFGLFLGNVIGFLLSFILKLFSGEVSANSLAIAGFGLLALVLSLAFAYEEYAKEKKEK